MPMPVDLGEALLTYLTTAQADDGVEAPVVNYPSISTRRRGAQHQT